MQLVVDGPRLWTSAAEAYDSWWLAVSWLSLDGIFMCDKHDHFPE
jgi:hypothetical protein